MQPTWDTDIKFQISIPQVILNLKRNKARKNIFPWLLIAILVLFDVILLSEFFKVIMAKIGLHIPCSLCFIQIDEK